MGLDLGTSSLKALLLNEKGKIDFVRSFPYHSYMPAPGWIEQDPGDYEKVLEQVIAVVLKEVPPQDIQAIGFSGHMSAAVLTDTAGKPVTRCITLSDNRSIKESREIALKAEGRIFSNTGNPVITAFCVPKLLWLKQNREEEFRRAAYYITPKDYLRFLLCGNLSAEYTDAANSLLLDRNGEWDLDLIETLGLPQQIFPAILKPWEKAGEITEEAALHFGLKKGTPVIAGGADMACGALGTGLFKPGDSAVTIGTSATFLCAVSKPGDIGRGQITYHPHAIPGCYYAIGSHFNGGLLLNWLSALFSPKEEIDYALLDNLAAKASAVSAGSGGVLCLPFLVGSGSPYFSAADSAAFIGMAQTSGKIHLFKSALEGIAFNLCQTLGIFEEIIGGDLQNIRLAGGGVKIQGWDQIITDVFGKSTRVVNCPDASAAGAAILGAYGAGFCTDMSEAAASCIEDKRILFPDSKVCRIYKDLYRLWINAHDVLENIMENLKNPP
jgi:xylulokinase